jgi:(R,R)-butanediol dehydrogenase/meso-butanediol dehydrogenase/diacetyl reductase
MEANTAPFVERNPKLNVVSSPATGGAWPDKPLSMFAAGTPPDILSGDVFHFRWQLAEQGALTPLDAYIRVDRLDLQDFDPRGVAPGQQGARQRQQGMKGVIFTGGRRCEVRDVPVPRPGHGEVLVGVRAAGICGSDLHVYRRQEASDQVRGHEAAGVVEAVGPGVLRLRPGQRVSIHHHQGCGVCPDCARGETVACSVKHEIVGVHLSGAFGEYVVAQERNCIPLPAQASFVDGAFYACVGSTAYGALRRLGVMAHQSLAVYGLGPVGLSCVLVGRALGLRVVGVDPVPRRVALALECGAQEALNAAQADAVAAVRRFGRVEGFDGSDGVDFVVETSGSAAGRANVVPSLRREGRAALVGAGSSGPVIDGADILARAATLIGSVVFPLGWMWDLARLCASSGLRFEPAVTHRFALDQAPEALAVADGAQGGKVVFECGASAQ